MPHRSLLRKKETDDSITWIKKKQSKEERVGILPVLLEGVLSV